MSAAPAPGLKRRHVWFIDLLELGLTWGSMLYHCAERLVHTMIARDEGRIDTPHHPSACVGFESLSG
jgi:hypothetical protein